MKSIILKTYLIFIGFLLSSCASTYFMLDPDEESNYEMGRRVIIKETETAYSEISFEEHSEEYFIFNIYVYNKSGNDHVFDPSQIYLKYYDHDKSIIPGVRSFALDPEIQINSLDENIKKRESLHETSTGFNIVFALFDTFVDLADDEDNNAEEVMENVLIFGENQISEEIDYENDMEYLKSTKSFWKNHVLRKTLLSTQEYAEGMIFLPINKDAKFIKIYLPLGDAIHTYKFRQVEID